MADKNQALPEPMNRTELIRLCSQILGKMEQKLSGRYRPNENENLYLQAVRAMSGLIGTTNQILRDTELEELQKRISALENPQGEESREKIQEFA